MNRRELLRPLALAPLAATLPTCDERPLGPCVGVFRGKYTNRISQADRNAICQGIRDGGTIVLTLPPDTELEILYPDGRREVLKG
jgi:hypothetical protein